MRSEKEDAAGDRSGPLPRASPPSGRWLKWVVLGLAALLYLYFNRSPRAAFEWERDLEAGLARARATNRPVLLEFQTAGCPACEWMDREVFSRESVARALAGWIPIRIDGNAHPKLTIQYGVEAFPTFFAMTPDAKILGKSVGPAPENDFISFLQSSQAKLATN